MTKQEERQLQRQLRALGSTTGWTNDNFQLVERNGSLRETQRFSAMDRPDFLDIDWRIDNLPVIRYDVTLRKHIEIPNLIIAGIDLTKLSSRMGKIDWRKDYFNPLAERGSKKNTGQPLVKRILEDWKAVRAAGQKGKSNADLLALKYFAGTLNEQFIQNMAQLKASHQRTLSFSTDKSPITALQAYNLLDGRYILKYKPTANGERWNWTGVAPGIRDAEGKLILTPVNGSEQFDPLLACKEMGMRGYPMDVMDALQNGSKIALPLEIGGVRAERVVFADPVNQRMWIDKAETEKAGMYRVPDIKLYQSRFAAHADYLPNLLERAREIGIEQANISLLEEQVIMYGLPFSLVQSKIYGQDTLRFTIHFAKDDQERFGIDRIVAESSSAKPLIIQSIGRVNLETLQKRMNEIDWATDFYSIKANLFHDQHPAGNPRMKAQVDLVVNDFQQLLKGGDVRGKAVAYHLAEQYLKGTPNQGIITDLDEEWEKALRKYTFPGAPLFKLESLYNLMNQRFVALPYDQGEDKIRQTWYQLVDNISNQTNSSTLRVIPGQFSVKDAISAQIGLVGKELALLEKKLTQQLKAGNVGNTFVNNEHCAIPVAIYADPVAKTLQVDLPKTFALSAYATPAKGPVLTTLPLGEFIQVVRKARSASAATHKILQHIRESKKELEPGERNAQGIAKKR